MSQTPARTPAQPALVRPCFAQDLESVRLLLNHHALTGYTWLEEAPLSLEETQTLWSFVVGADLPFLVACPRADISRVVGVGFARPGLFGAPSLQGGPEIRVAVTPALLRHGIGSALTDSLLDDLQSGGAARVFASYGKTEPSPPAAMLARAGFGPAGVLEGAARKFGRRYDVAVQSKAMAKATQEPNGA